MTRTPRAMGLGLGYVADLVFGDPRRGHPVAGFGTVAGGLESLTYQRNRRAGVVHVGVLVGAAAALGGVMERGALRAPGRLAGYAEAGLVAAATWCVLGGRSLLVEGRAIERHLATGALSEARGQLTHLVSRRTSDLGPDEIARAAVESVAENASDAVVAPLLWIAVAGVPGGLTYRAINTLDAMVGYRNERYREFGWAAARLDDLVNWAPARVTALLAVVLAPVAGGRPCAAIRVWRRDAPHHPSPNAGPVEAAFAGALGRRLGGSNVYDGVVEDRGVLGDGPPVTAADLAAAVRLARWVSAAAAAAAVGLAVSLREIASG